jgi:hypothetical protein
MHHIMSQVGMQALGANNGGQTCRQTMGKKVPANDRLFHGRRAIANRSQAAIRPTIFVESWGPGVIE